MTSRYAARVGALVVPWTPDRSLDELTRRWAPPPSTFLELDGMQVHVRDEGPSDDPLPLVLLHGTGSSLHTWDGWAERLKATRRVVRLDRPGFGLTGPNPSGTYSMAYYSDFVRRFLDRMEIARCVLVGNSSGGRVAWHVAVDAPEQVAQLVLIAAAGYPRDTPLPLGMRIAQHSLLGPLMTRYLPRSAAAAGVRRSYGDPHTVTAAVVDRSYELTLRPGNRAALGETLRQAHEGADAARITDIRVPTLILWGSRDTVIPPANARRFHADIAHSQLVLFPELGHLPQEEDPEATVSAVEAFLAP